MTKVSVNAPRTPVTEGSSGIAAATLPNVCKMPGPPAPFVPTPLPNIGKSGTDPKGYSKTVTIEGQKVGIRGATFGSMGDVASKGTGGGIVSSNVEGPTSFVGPGSMDVKIEGKNVQLLGDPMLNNCGPSGSPPNAATMMGVLQMNGTITVVTGDDKCPLCRKEHGALKEITATKDSAGQLAEKLARNIYTNKLAPLNTMIGVIQCKCKKKYSDMTSATREGFRDAVIELGWHASKFYVHEVKEGDDEKAARASKDKVAKDTRERVRSFLEKRFSQHEKIVHRTWEKARRRFDKFRAGEASSAYPPGACAGQKTLMLALEHGAYPAGLTEQWFHSEKQQTDGKIQFLDAKSNTIVERVFAHGETVPPCGSCELILPVMLCPGDKKEQCQH
jgi:hypothetical protein